ncbi:carbohydrate ABC transporter permease [Paenibacillus sp. MMS20-IR301]|uniref:carbohydrate ABC transporter permease n=1 Tax=Paenibacillus sp. MMS20-IR301 TaxID=2895946 RepID=UPI0028EC6638|nr:carbohydrate ABC transporter permease [Paenibacillus sp. MMS20-IR301]WNS43930.1 carbohydrate ABC transporter permease [Paenibacillus sp. MMS20-IR301]
MQTASARKINSIIHLILIISAIAMLVPFIWMVLTSLKTTTEATQIPIRYFPDTPSLRGYTEAIRQSAFPHYYMNTILTAIMKTVFPVIFSSMAAYAFARLRFPGSSFLFALIISVMMVPNPVFYTPQYMMMSDLGLVNTVTALWITSLISPFATFLLRQFFLGISKELEEASVLDGCNPFQIYWHIMLPLVKSALVAIVIIQLQWAWNELQWPLIINSSPEKMTLSSGIATLVSMFGTDYPVLMAGAFMAVVPMIVLFFIFQKQFIEGIAFSAHKG